MSLEEATDGKKFNQFKDKKSTYTFDQYTSKLDKTQITPDQKKQADQLEKEIGPGTLSSFEI